MSKVFLSHSSADKPLVEAVYRQLGERLAEFDQATFEGGLPNIDVITRALERCSIFAVFATSNALKSSWVTEEIREARLRLRDHRMKRILVFVTDGGKLEDLPATITEFAVFLTLNRPAPITRAIQRHLLDLAASEGRDSEQFVGRDRELAELKAELLDPSRQLNGVTVSGLSLMGRAALIRRAMNDLYPALLPPKRVVDFHIYESCADIAIDLHGSVNELISSETIADYRDRFRSDDATTCGVQLYEIVKDLAEQRQYVIFSDRGGIINHSGTFTNIASALAKAAPDSGELRVFYTTTRRPVPRCRSEFGNIAFLDIYPLDDEAARQYIIHRARRKRVVLTNEQIDTIIDLGKGLQQTYDFIIEKCRHYGVETALTDLDDIREVGRERSQMLLSGINIKDDARRLLSVMNHYFYVPGEFIETIFDDYSRGAAACAELLDAHVIVHSHGVYSISPPLVEAISRDRNYGLDGAEAKIIAKKFAKLLQDYREDGVVPVSIIDAASIAFIETGDTASNWTSHFILPSHYIYLARLAYNKRHYPRAIKYCLSAIGYRGSLTNGALIYACRTLGASAARQGNDEQVSQAIRLLAGIQDPLAPGALAFVKGFDLRLRGDFAGAETEYLKARKVLRDEAALSRELALVNLLMRNFERATSYGEVALESAPDSPYILDIVARALISSAPNARSLEYNARLADIMKRLERACQNRFHSFYWLRAAEYELRLGNQDEALRLANEGVEVTPDLAAPYVLRARIHLAMSHTREARSDRDKAKHRTRMGGARHRYFDAEIIRVEIDIAVKSRRWSEAVVLVGQMESFGVSDLRDIQRQIAKGINADRTDLEVHIRRFGEQHR